MSTKSKRSIIFCQGGKEDLEEITGEKFEYLKLEEIVSEQEIYPFEGEVLPTFIYTYTGAGEIMTHETLMDLLRDKAVAIGSDAIVFFYSDLQENSHSSGYARGTPVRKTDKFNQKD